MKSIRRFLPNLSPAAVRPADEALPPLETMQAMALELEEPAGIGVGIEMYEHSGALNKAGAA